MESNNMTYEEMCFSLVKVINIKEKEILELLKRLPFEKLTAEEQGRVIVSELFETNEVLKRSKDLGGLWNIQMKN